MGDFEVVKDGTDAISNTPEKVLLITVSEYTANGWQYRLLNSSGVVEREYTRTYADQLRQVAWSLLIPVVREVRQVKPLDLFNEVIDGIKIDEVRIFDDGSWGTYGWTREDPSTATAIEGYNYLTDTVELPVKKDN